MSGDELSAHNRMLATYKTGTPVNVILYSGQFTQKLAGLYKKGYRIYKAEIRFIVKWTDKEDSSEWNIVLPDIYLRKE
ncbi:MAG: hypothetical protein Q4F95_05225 [Oscillospiraceae bacterium]|nr:hypothetical protein [Oscillospiraceae bacterium]